MLFLKWNTKQNNHTNPFQYPISEFKKDTGWDRRKIYRAKNELVEIGLISVSQSGRQATFYTLYSADEIILHKIYSSARENAADFNITGRTLFEEAAKHLGAIESKSEDRITFSDGHVLAYYEDALDATAFVKSEIEKPLSSEYPDGYLVVTMGAGDNWKLGKALK